MKLIIMESNNKYISVYLNDYRIAGSKPITGAKVIMEKEVTEADLKNAVPKMFKRKYK